MRFYSVRYWQEGPGLSGPNEVLVIAKNRKAAIKLAKKECAIYKSDYDSISVKSMQKRYSKGMVIL